MQFWLPLWNNLGILCDFFNHFYIFIYACFPKLKEKNLAHSKSNEQWEEDIVRCTEGPGCCPDCFVLGRWHVGIAMWWYCSLGQLSLSEHILVSGLEMYQRDNEIANLGLFSLSIDQIHDWFYKRWAGLITPWCISQEQINHHFNGNSFFKKNMMLLFGKSYINSICTFLGIIVWSHRTQNYLTCYSGKLHWSKSHTLFKGK